MKLIRYNEKYKGIVNEMYGAASKKLTNFGLYKVLTIVGVFKSYLFLYMSDDKIIHGGGAILKKLNLSTLKIEIWIAGIYVIEQYRRQNHGSKLMNLLFDECKARGYNDIYLYVDKNNIAANNLYLKLGFQIIGTYKHYFKMVYSIKHYV